MGRLGQADVDAAAGILFDAFGAAYRRRGHAPPFPTRESAAWLCRAYIDLDPEGCALARSASEIVGVGFAHPRGAVTSIGPLASRPGAPAGVARALMGELGGIAAGSSSVRLFQDSFNPDSFGLYTRLGYVVSDVAPVPARREARAARRHRPPRPTAGGRRPPGRRALRSSAHGRRPPPRSRAARVDGRGLHLPGGGGAASTIGGYLFFRALPARVVIGPAVAESAEMLAALVDGVAASLPGRAAGDSRLGRRAGAAQAGVRSRFSRRSPRRTSWCAGRMCRLRRSSTRCSRKVCERGARSRCRAIDTMVCSSRLAAVAGRVWVGPWTFAAIAVRPNTSSRTIASPSAVRPCNARPAGTRSWCRGASRPTRRRPARRPRWRRRPGC